MNNVNINTINKYIPSFSSSTEQQVNTKPLVYYKSDSDEVKLSREVIKQRKQKKQIHSKIQKIGIAGASLMLAVSILAGTGNRNNTKVQNNNEVIYQTELPYITVETQNPYTEPVEEEPEYTTEPSLSPEDILDSAPEIREQYDKLKSALTRFSEELGEDGLSLIQERVNEIGDGKVNLIDVLKILWIESKGRIYDKDNPDEILQSYTGEAFGPFQLTPDTVDLLNRYYGLNGTDNELDIMNPYDNLDACIYNLKFLYDKRREDIESGEKLPTGDNIYDAIAWSYHDGAWASSITDHGQNYIEQFRNLSILDEYPDLIDYLAN